MLIHTDQKPFQCDACDQSFRQKQLLKRHQNLYHNPNYVPPQPKVIFAKSCIFSYFAILAALCQFLSIFVNFSLDMNEKRVKTNQNLYDNPNYVPPQTFANSGNFGTFCHSGYFWLYFGYIWENARYSTSSQLLST